MVGRYTFEALRQLNTITALLAAFACLLACVRALACRGWGPLRAVGMTDSGQFRSEMEASWDLVDRKYDAPEIFGDRAADVRAGRPPRPSSCTVTHGWHCGFG